jgi:carboxylate-amine ligase
MSLQPIDRATGAAAAPAPAGFTLGVEEELFIVDPRAPETRLRVDPIVRPPRFARGRIMGEMCDGVVELATPVCQDANRVGESLSGLRQGVVASGRPVGLLGVGVHPTAPFGDVHHRRSPHYDRVSDGTRGLLRQAAYCGVHVHVGMDDREMTIAAFNGMRKWIPLLQALSANSPFWHGQDSGLASARTVVCHSVPRTGLPRAFRDWADYSETISEICRVAEIDDPGSIWWDMRPHPTLGTLEIRCLDAQSSLDDLVALVALTHGLVQHEALVADGLHPSSEILAEASFRALRDGIDARFSVGGPVVALADLAVHAMDIAVGYLGTREARAALRGIESLLTEGNGAQRQRRAFARGGMPGVLELLQRETCAFAYDVPDVEAVS